jgi:molecular chaperone DnaJ
MSKDYYTVLGVSKTASDQEIKSAYRKLAMQYHPDRNKDDKAAEAKFKEVGEAYEVLKDPAKRRDYDRFGSSAFSQGGFGGGRQSSGRGGFGGGRGPSQGDDPFNIFEDLFGDMMGGGRGSRKPQTSTRGSDLRYNLSISLEDAFFGKAQEINFKSYVKCDSCNATGCSSKKMDYTACNDCGGSGAQRMQQGFFVIEQTCNSCQGSGQKIKDPCKPCKGQGRVEKSRNISVSIPAGIETDTKIRLASEGEAGARGGSAGDLYVFVQIKPHKTFKVKGADLYSSINVPLSLAVLGGEIEQTMLDGSKVQVSIPKGSQPNSEIKIKSQGMPYMKSSSKGDLYLNLTIKIPTNLNSKQQELFEAFAKECQSSEESSGFFSKFKNWW